MKVVKYKQANHYAPEPGWERTSLCFSEPISIEHFVKPPGHASLLHKHHNIQVLVVLEGELEVTDAQGHDYYLEKNDTIYIDADEPHVVRNPGTSEAKGLDIFIPGRSFDFWRQRQP
jgi:mannose-6-phosphate isomerase-like protein (cupin superfamily)